MVLPISTPSCACGSQCLRLTGLPAAFPSRDPGHNGAKRGLWHQIGSGELTAEPPVPLRWSRRCSERGSRAATTAVCSHRTLALAVRTSKLKQIPGTTRRNCNFAFEPRCRLSVRMSQWQTCESWVKQDDHNFQHKAGLHGEVRRNQANPEIFHPRLLWSLARHLNSLSAGSGAQPPCTWEP